jgi:hypothetical protein
MNRATSKKTFNRLSLGRARITALLAGLLAIIGVVAIAQPASATTSAANGSMPDAGIVIYWDTQRLDTHTKNTDKFELKTITEWAGGEFVVAMRNLSGGSYARVEFESLNTYNLIKNDNGNSWNPPTTFYLNTELDGYCGEDGCGTINFTGELSYNVAA